MTRPTATELHVAVTVGVTASALLAYVGYEACALAIALPSNLAWVWESKIERNPNGPIHTGVVQRCGGHDGLRADRQS